MKEVFRKHTISFIHALDGLKWALRTQPNFRVHFVLSALAMVLSVYFRITPVEFLIIIFTILLGLTVEMINTSMEAMTDLIRKEYSEDAKVAKDVSAGMMLIVAVGAIVVAFSIFLPRFIARFSGS